MSLKFTYSLCGAGWAEAMICVDDSCHEIAVSYIYDSLSELTSAINQILNAEKDSVDIHFLDEPGGHKIVLSMIEADNLSVELFLSKEWIILKEPMSMYYTPVFSTTTNKNYFANLVLTILENILEQHGEDGYKEQWINHDFPSEEYQKLKLLLTA